MDFTRYWSNLQRPVGSALPPAPSNPIPSTSTQGGVKRERNLDNDDADKAPARKKVTISRKPCIVCTDDVPKNRFPKLPHKRAANNEHSSDVCFKCFREHVRNEVEIKGHEEAGCPQCSQPLEESDIRKLASSRTYKEYLDKAAKECMQQEEEYHACPNAECSWGAYFAKDDGNIFSYVMCKARYCLDCEVPFHERQTCDEYQADAKRRNEDEQKSLATVKQLSRPCPGPGCGINIDKYTGCDHVTCRRCEYQLCWECFAPYGGPNGIFTIGNSVHKDTCRHFPTNEEIDEEHGFYSDVESDEEDEDDSEEEDEGS